MHPCHLRNSLGTVFHRTVMTHTRSNNATHIRTAPVRNNLLITFDAFETLFHPKRSAPEEYSSTAHAFGLSPTLITADRVKEAFKDVFKTQKQRRPNYGREDVLRGQYGGPKQWWDEVIKASLLQAVKGGSDGGQIDDANFVLPDGLTESLINRFAGSEGYRLYDDVVPFFERMRYLKSVPHTRGATAGFGIFDRVLFGVISNSDDRVPAVLKSLGLSVGDVRADQERSSMTLPGFEEREDSQNQNKEDYFDLDLVITSYEAGEEKPNRLIFDVAKRQALRLARSELRDEERNPADSNMDNINEKWVYVHVGDDYEMDYKGAINAGWDSYLLPRGNNIDGIRDAKVVHSLMDLIVELEKKYA